MTTRDKFLLSVERKAILLGHILSPWEKDNWGFHTKCTACGVVVNVKVGLKVSDLSDEMCKGKQKMKIPSPGKLDGPHDYQCGHLKCHEKFQTAGATCQKCKRTIGFDVEFERDEAGKLQHVVCPGEATEGK